jgi:NAD(P)-dependent dehydrogenase (short-subunit alcohol dehydrogenase family)
VLAGDLEPDALGVAAKTLSADGLDVVTQQVDVTSRDSVTAFATRAGELGPARQIVCTAGVSPEQASVEQILRVDLAGVARVLEVFEPRVTPGGAAVVIASLAGHLGMHPISAEQEAALATVPAEELLALPFVAPQRFADAQAAYGFAKHANRVRVRSAAVTWGARGARVNSISPGIVSTTMGERELAGPFGDVIRAMAAGSPSGRLGTAEDVACAAEFLLGPGAGYVTGTDLLLDGGVLAATRHGRDQTQKGTP